MDYTLELKKDILKSLPRKRECRLAFLYAVTKSRGGIDVYKKSISLTYEFEDKEEALAVLEMVKEEIDGDAYFLQKGDKKIIYCVQLKDEVANSFLKTLDLNRFEKGSFVAGDVGKYISSLSDTEEFFSFFKGAVLTDGQLKFPDADYSNYSMQIKLASEDYAQALKEKMAQFEQKRYETQLAVMQTGKQDEEKFKEVQDLYAELVEIEDAKKFFEAETKFNIVIADVNKIIGEAIRDVIQ